jgi:hypothetical protein
MLGKNLSGPFQSILSIPFYSGPFYHNFITFAIHYLDNVVRRYPYFEEEMFQEIRILRGHATVLMSAGNSPVPPLSFSSYPQNA